VQVRLSQEQDKQSSEELTTDKQKELHVQVTETTDVEHEIHHLCVHVLRFNALRHKELSNETNLERDNQLLENQFMAELKVTATTELLLLLPPFYRQLYRTTVVRTGGFCESSK